MVRTLFGIISLNVMGPSHNYVLYYMITIILIYSFVLNLSGVYELFLHTECHIVSKIVAQCFCWFACWFQCLCILRDSSVNTGTRVRTVRQAAGVKSLRGTVVFRCKLFPERLWGPHRTYSCVSGASLGLMGWDQTGHVYTLPRLGMRGFLQLLSPRLCNGFTL